jgi:hypothetical protein
MARNYLLDNKAKPEEFIKKSPPELLILIKK